MRLFGFSLTILALTGCLELTSGTETQIQVSGTWEHSASGLQFPEQVGEFLRVGINQYDQAGTDVGVGYNHEVPDAPVAFTVFIRPPIRLPNSQPMPLAEQFDMEKDVIHEYHPGAVEIWSASRSVETGEGPVQEGLGAEFEYSEVFSYRRQQVFSQLYLFEVNGSVVKYRATFPVETGQSSRAVVESFLALAPWGSFAVQQAAAPDGGQAFRLIVKGVGRRR